jgi:hypothetical protein
MRERERERERVRDDGEKQVFGERRHQCHEEE